MVLHPLVTSVEVLPARFGILEVSCLLVVPVVVARRDRKVENRPNVVRESDTRASHLRKPQRAGLVLTA